MLMKAKRIGLNNDDRKLNSKDLRMWFINMDLVIETPELPFPGETVLARNLREIPGGKGANQAVGAARLGAEVVMVGRVGDDAYGEKLLANLEREGVRSTYLQRTDCSSGIALVAVEDSGENSILVVPGANGRLSPDDIVSDAIAGCDVVLLQLEIPLPTVLHAIDLAKRFKKTILMNPAPAPANLTIDYWMSMYSVQSN